VPVATKVVLRKLLFLRRGDIAAILLGIALAGGFGFLAFKFPFFGRRSNWGFGPEWTCVGGGRGDPICFKQPGTN
jgi:hypothetical protein